MYLTFAIRITHFRPTADIDKCIAMAEIMPKPTIAVISIGQMGLGIASLLRQHSYPVVTSLEGRSDITRKRAEIAGIRALNLVDLVQGSDLILSIVPPKDAMAMAHAVVSAAKHRKHDSSERKLTYLELNAVSPHLARNICTVIETANIAFVDGGILGFPPKRLDDGTWFRPALVTSGPLLAAIPQSAAQDLIAVLNIRHISNEIGSASGLKMCFGAIYKGHAAIAFQAYTTASSLGILPALQDHLKEFFPEVAERVESSMLGSQQKAYRWIKEMEEIRETFADEGNWSSDLFTGVADVFRVVGKESRQDMHLSIDKLVDEIFAAQRRRLSRI